MRGRGLCIVVGVLLLAPVAALADDPAPACGSGPCGTPSCWGPKVRTRPDVIRSLRVTCLGAVGATVVTQPSFGTVSDVTTSADRLLFTLHEAAIGPRFDEAVFRVDGHEHPIDLHVAIESIPSAENHAPVCQGDNVTQRSDGSSSVDLFVHPWCYDPDGDDFVMEGGGPGVHPQSPKTVPPGDSEANWYYRTATHAGTETTPIWATDSLGARSPDATLTVTVGPDVDRLPVCHPNPYSLPAPAVYSIYSRPGATRRFGLICEDADTDPFDVGL